MVSSRTLGRQSARRGSMQPWLQLRGSWGCWSHQSPGWQSRTAVPAAWKLSEASLQWEQEKKKKLEWHSSLSARVVWSSDSKTELCSSFKTKRKADSRRVSPSPWWLCTLICFADWLLLAFATLPNNRRGEIQRLGQIHKWWKGVKTPVASHQLLWIIALKSNNSWIQVFKMKAVLLLGILSQWESEGDQRWFDMCGFDAVLGAGGHQTSVPCCSGSLLDHFSPLDLGVMPWFATRVQKKHRTSSVFIMGIL